MSKNKKNKKDYERRSRNQFIELYCDNSEHMEALDYIENNCVFAGIKHDNDYYDDEEHEEGEKKKEHYHIILHLQEARSRSAIAKELNIEKRFIEPIDNLYKTRRYLLHLDNDDKTKYLIDEVFGNDIEKVKKACAEDIDINEFFIEFVNYLNSLDRVVSYTECQLYFANKNALGYLRNISFWTYTVDEHNAKY